jgi:hypothetical protein
MINKFQKMKEKLNLHNDFISVKVINNIDGKYRSCFNNVKEYIPKHGGSIVYGWQIEESSFLIEAVAHAIWKSPLGEYYCVSPQKNTYIDFIEDFSLDSSSRPNIRIEKYELMQNRHFVSLLHLIDKVEISTINFLIKHTLTKPYEQNLLKLHDIKKDIILGCDFLNKPELYELMIIREELELLNQNCFKFTSQKDLLSCVHNNKYEQCCGTEIITKIKNINNQFNNIRF